MAEHWQDDHEAQEEGNGAKCQASRNNEAPRRHRTGIGHRRIYGGTDRCVQSGYHRSELAGINVSSDFHQAD